MTDHDKLEELLRIKNQAPLRFRIIVGSNACSEMSLEIHDPALFRLTYVFGHVRQSERIATMMVASKEDA